MSDRVELMEAALDVYPEGLALLDEQERVAFWNHAAEVISGYPGAEMIGRHLPDGLESLSAGRPGETHNQPRNDTQPGHGSLVHAQHKLGHDVPAIARRVVLRDGLGARIGSALAFHPAESFTALPHGETANVEELRQSRAEFRDRLENEFNMFVHEGVPLAVLWIAVDQGQDLRRTHGARACETMLETVERTLANALHPGEEIGRWGDTEFLVLSHQTSPYSLPVHAQTLAGLARTADFRWWGDRVSLTVSVGAATALHEETLAGLLDRARDAMHDSARAGGNHISVAARRQPCSQS